MDDSNVNIANAIYTSLKNNNAQSNKDYLKVRIMLLSNNLDITNSEFLLRKDFYNNLVQELRVNNYKVSRYTNAIFPGKNDGMPYNWWNNETYLQNNFKLGLNSFPTLTAQEKVLVSLFPFAALVIFKNKSVALSTTQTIFPTAFQLNDKADAFRHAFFNALNVRDIFTHSSVIAPTTIISAKTILIPVVHYKRLFIIR